MLRKWLCDEFPWMDLLPALLASRDGLTMAPARRPTPHHSMKTRVPGSIPPGASTLVITSEGIDNNFDSYMLKGPRAVRSSICFFA